MQHNAKVQHLLIGLFGGPIINPIPQTFCELEERSENVKNNKNGISWYLSFQNANDCQQNCVENREVKKLENGKETK